MSSTYDFPGRELQSTDDAQAAGDYIPLPRKLTVENGAKAALIGEFSETVEIMGEDGEEHPMDVPVSWDTIKRIWDAAVAHFAAQPPAAPVETSDGAIYAAISKRDLTPEERSMIEKSILDASEVLYPLEPVQSCSAETEDDHCPTCDLTHVEHERIIHKWCKDPFHQRATDIGKQRIRKFVVCGDCGLEEHCGERCPNAEISGQEG